MAEEKLPDPSTGTPPTALGALSLSKRTPAPAGAGSEACANRGEGGVQAPALQGRRLLVAVSGGIAAYKVAALVSRLVKDGAEVRVTMTEAAQKFVGPVTFRALTNRPVAVDMWVDLPEPVGYEHLALARFAEVLVLAPATANTLAKLAHGLADNLVTSTILATQAPVLLVPAMNAAMWENPLTQANVARLQEVGFHFVGPETGRLGCGETGAGRMAEPETIREAILALLAPPVGPLSSRRVLITAGPTREWLDPVRFISNPSTGKMGLALAQEAAARGAQVTVVLGPTAEPVPAGVVAIRVETAAEMHQAVAERLTGTDVFIGAAAVADYRPEARAEQKQKKTGEPLELTLVPTVDILREVASSPDRPAVVVGFAAESQDLEAQAAAKLERKHLDLIVANDITQPGAGFGSDTNEALLLDRTGKREVLSRRPKRDVARRICERIAELLR
jgi:phosphopantothenoylcysteine decarboxylase/phosphopantothenate--cysteine ligase